MTPHRVIMLDNIVKCPYDAIRIDTGKAVYFMKDGKDIAYVTWAGVVGQDTFTITNVEGFIPLELYGV